MSLVMRVAGVLGEPGDHDVAGRCQHHVDDTVVGVARSAVGRCQSRSPVGSYLAVVQSNAWFLFWPYENPLT